jgi:hypothetical protein
MTRKIHPLLFLGLTLLPGGIRAQGVQNSDIFWLFGANSIPSQSVGGSAATLNGDTGVTIGYGYGYQIVRKSAASLWVEFSPIFGGANPVGASIPGAVNLTWNAYPIGVRFMIPLQSRVSVYAAAGGGAGNFHVPQIVPGATLSITSVSTWHGVFDFGGGVDVRLARRISLRAEIRDYATGAGLSGVAGRNHPVASGGFGLHF